MGKAEERRHAACKMANGEVKIENAKVEKPMSIEQTQNEAIFLQLLIVVLVVVVLLVVIVCHWRWRLFHIGTLCWQV